MDVKNYEKGYEHGVKAVSQFCESDCSLQAASAVRCDYFISNEPENCFIVTDEFDKPVGVALMSLDRKKLLALMPSYIESVKAENRALYRKHKRVLKKLAKLDAPYSAFLSIIVLPAFRDKGIAKQLFNKALTFLREKGALGVCALADTPEASAFAELLGMGKSLRVDRNAYLYAMKL